MAPAERAKSLIVARCTKCTAGAVFSQIVTLICGPNMAAQSNGFTQQHVTIRKGDKVQRDVRFRGGMSKSLMLPRPVSYCESHKQNPDMIAEMDLLWNHYNYADVARILNERNFKTGDGLPLTSVAVGYVRKAYRLKSRFDRLRQRGLLTISEMAQICGVCTKTISEWREKGLLRGHAINDRNQYLFENPGPNPPKKQRRTISRKAA